MWRAKEQKNRAFDSYLVLARKDTANYNQFGIAGLRRRSTREALKVEFSFIHGQAEVEAGLEMFLEEVERAMRIAESHRKACESQVRLSYLSSFC